MPFRDNPPTSKPVPVILATDPLRELWPWSTPSRPWPFQRDSTGVSNFEHVIRLFAADRRFKPAIVIATEAAATAAIEQISPFFSHGARLISVPDRIGSGVAALLAAMEVGASDPEAPLAFLPPTLLTQSSGESGLTDHLARAAIVASVTPVVFVRTSTMRDSGIAWLPSARDTRTGLPIAGRDLDLGRMNAQDNDPDHREIQTPAGPAICLAKAYIDVAFHAAPVMVKSVASAIALGDRSMHVGKPLAECLELSSNHSVFQFMRQPGGLLLLNPAGAEMLSVQDWTDLPWNSGEERASHVATAGIGEHRVVAGPGGVFVFAPGHECDAARFFGQHAAAMAASSKQSTQHPWGVEHEVESIPGLRILRLELKTGGVMEPELHRRRHETWHIVRGFAIVTISGTVQTAGAGTILPIRPGESHSMRNAGVETLVVYETRSGTDLGVEDRVTGRNLPGRDDLALVAG